MRYIIGLAIIYFTISVVYRTTPQRRQGSQKPPISTRMEPERKAGSTTEPKRSLDFPIISQSPCLKCAIDSVVFIQAYTHGQNVGFGSGVILREDGIILTNMHVIAGADTVEVTMRDKQKATVTEILGHSFDLDYALLKVELNGMPAIRLSSGQALDVTQKVFAIGAPRGLNWSITDGIISRILTDPLSGASVIQHTASIAPGSSGGALVDETGALIGINTLVQRDTPRFSYAVDLSQIRKQLPEKGVVAAGTALSRVTIGDRQPTGTVLRATIARYSTQ